MRLVISVRLSACIKAAPIGWISLKFDVWDLYEYLSEKSKLGYNRAKIAGTLREYLIMCYKSTLTVPFFSRRPEATTKSDSGI